LFCRKGRHVPHCCLTRAECDECPESFIVFPSTGKEELTTHLPYIIESVEVKSVDDVKKLRRRVSCSWDPNVQFSHCFKTLR
jgi:hypothetical protein